MYLSHLSGNNPIFPDELPDETKKGKADYIAPLRPPTLAAIKPWGNLEGAGRVRLSRCKDKQDFDFCKTLLLFFYIFEAQLMPSRAEETIPPAYPAPSPHGYRPAI